MTKDRLKEIEVVLAVTPDSQTFRIAFELFTEVRKLRSVLKDFEWSDTTPDGNPRCPNCYYKMPTHQTTCELNAAINGT